MVLALVVSLLTGQVIYEWVDSKGQSHFTDDPATIPASAKRRVTTGAELVVVAAPKTDAGAVDAGVAAKVTKPTNAAPPAGPDSCTLAAQLVTELEREVEKVKLDAQQADVQEDQRCQEALRTQGQYGYAQCMASRTKRAPPSTAAAAKLEEARETLRRAQVGGCR